MGLFVAIAIVWAAIEVFKGAHTTFSDQQRLDPREVMKKVIAFEAVEGRHNIRSRGTGAIIHMDLERWLCGQYEGLVDVVIHVEPNDTHQRSRSIW